MISICIPAYSGIGVEMLRELLGSIRMQTFTDYEIVVSDDTRQSTLTDLVDGRTLWIPGREGAAANLNNAIDHARGEIIKPMFQDDKFMEPDTLQKIADAFMLPEAVDMDSTERQSVEWVACASHNEGEGYETWDHVPYAHSTLANLREGENTYGSPSAMAWRRNDLRFDENLKWLLDCEFYSRMAERYGVPAFVDTPIFIRQWAGQATRLIATGSQRIADLNYVVEKYRD